MKPALRRCLLVTLAAALCAGNAACVSLADRIVTPPPGPRPSDDSLAGIETLVGIERRSYLPPLGPELAYRVVPAARTGFDYEYEREGGDIRFELTLDALTGDDKRPAPVPVEGTVVMLHGWGMDGRSMLAWALALAERGYRSILVDLRSHGESGKADVGYGPAEGRDVAGLVAHLRDEGLVQGTSALFGVSYGAVAALHAASILQEDVDGVVALSPYANAATGIRGFVHGSKRMGGTGLLARLQRSWMRARHGEATVDRAIAQAGRRVGVDLFALDTAPAVRDASACVVLLHGSDDGFFDIDDVRALADVSPRAGFVELDGETHFTAPLRLDLLAGPLADWLDALPANPCPALDLSDRRASHDAS